LTESDPIRRLGTVAGFVISMLTNLEKSIMKPFNPMLGETFEFVTDKYKFIAE
jgi:hypothetical protein